MKAYFSINNQQEFYSELQQKIGTSYYFDSFERCIEIHPEIGRGKIRSFQFASGLELHIQEYLTKEPVLLELDINYSTLGLGWVISGHSNFSLKNQDFCLKPQDNIVTYSNNIYGSFEMVANKRVVIIELSLERYINQPTFAKQKEHLPNKIRNLIHNNNSGIFFQSAATTSAMNIVLHQILNCPYQSLTKQLYLESKAIELLALNLEILEQDRKKVIQKYIPNKSEIDCLHYAKEILINNLDNPPTLNTLARQIGLNEYKLKQGFRYIFDTTVFGYLHNYRMEQSRLLLESGTMNVTEVAQAVGYSNLSHFAAAFRKKFGVNPSVFRKGIRS